MDDWESTLAGLRRAFLDRIPSFADDAESAIAGMRREPRSNVHLSALRLVLHKIVGSGGSFGLAGIAATAAASEALCREHLDAATTPTADQLDGIQAHIASIREQADLERNSSATLESEAQTFRDSSSVIST